MRTAPKTLVLVGLMSAAVSCKQRGVETPAAQVATPKTVPAAAESPSSPVTPPEPARTVGTAVTPAEVIKRVKPDFSGLGSQGSRGVCLAEVTVGENGRVSGVRNLRPGRPERDRIIVDAIKRWRFKPAMANGKPVAAYFFVSIDDCPE